MPKNILAEDAELDAAIDEALAEIEAELAAEEDEDLDEAAVLAAPGQSGTATNVAIGKDEQASVDSVAKVAKQTKKTPARRGDQPDNGDSKSAGPLVLPKSKAGMISAALDLLQKASKEEIAEKYEALVAVFSGKTVVAEGKQAVEGTFSRKITAADLDLSADVAAILGEGKDLSEEFKKNVQTVFEAAVVSKVNEKLAELATHLETVAKADHEEASKDLEEQVDLYLDYVVEQWMAENKLAVERGLRAEIVEDFMKGLKSLFDQNYIDIPEEKVSVVEDLATKVEEQQKMIDQLLKDKKALDEQVNKGTASTILADAAKGLSENQAAKLAQLAEGVTFTTADDFKGKIATLKETYFKAAAPKTGAASETEEEVRTLAEDTNEQPQKRVDPEMSKMIDALSRLAPKK